MSLSSTTNSRPAAGSRPLLVAAAIAAAGAGGALVATLTPPTPVAAVTSLAQDSFAVCTAPLDSGLEAVFVLDFETGDLTGSVINQSTSRFGAGFRHNVLKDLEFKKVKDPKFLLVTGQAALAGQASGRLAPTILYVTDAATGVTVAYGIPWNSQQVAGGAAPPVQPLVPLDMIRPRGGGTKVR